MSATAGIPRELAARFAQLDSLAADVSIQYETLHEHSKSLKAVVASFKMTRPLQIELIQAITASRSELQLLAHALETDPGQRWRPARLLSILGNTATRARGSREHQQTQVKASTGHCSSSARFKTRSNVSFVQQQQQATSIENTKGNKTTHRHWSWKMT